jgi:CheY-like chemotaxis protein
MKILVVEDDPLLRDGLADLLKGAGHTVDMVSDGLTATKRGMDPELDLVLLDVMLPRLDGIEVCHRLRKARPDLPILMLTAKGAEEDTDGASRHHCRQRRVSPDPGAVGHLSRPHVSASCEIPRAERFFN